MNGRLAGQVRFLKRRREASGVRNVREHRSEAREVEVMKGRVISEAQARAARPFDLLRWSQNSAPHCPRRHGDLGSPFVCRIKQVHCDD